MKVPLYLGRTSLIERNVKLSALDFVKLNIYVKVPRVTGKYELSNKQRFFKKQMTDFSPKAKKGEEKEKENRKKRNRTK